MDNIDKKDSLAGAAGQELTDKELELVAGGAGSREEFKHFTEEGCLVYGYQDNMHMYIVLERRYNGDRVECYVKFYKSKRQTNMPHMRAGWYLQADLRSTGERGSLRSGGGSG